MPISNNPMLSNKMVGHMDPHNNERMVIVIVDRSIPEK